MEAATEIKESLDAEWIPAIYREKVRTQRTRSYHINVPRQENQAEILYTLLGIELKSVNTVFPAPIVDRQIFTGFCAHWLLGRGDPYDITKISTLADELEISWHKTILLFEEKASERIASARGRMRSQLIREIRQEIEEIGAGALMPEFKQTTKQREP
jgi:hypothetical protein